MKIELKNLSYNHRLSQETHAYSASLYVDGKKIGTVSNNGSGGCDGFYGDRDAYMAADKWCKENLPHLTLNGKDIGPTDIESVCADLVTEILLMRDMRRQMRRGILFVENGKLMQVTYKGIKAIEPKHISAFRTKHPSAKPLNELPEDEAFKLYKRYG